MKDIEVALLVDDLISVLDNYPHILTTTPEDDGVRISIRVFNQEE